MPNEATASTSPDVQPSWGSPEWVADFASRYGMLPMSGAETPPGGGAPSAGGDGQGGGEGGAKGGEGDFWGMFPDVPEEQRPLLEPHLKNVQGHVTQLEQQLAPFKPALDQGLDPQELPALLNFNQQFSQNPVGTWLMLAQRLQQEGVIPEHLDLEAVQEAIETDPSQLEQGGEDEFETGEGDEIPPYVQEMQRELEELRNTTAQERQQRQEQIQDRVLDGALENMRSQLREAGVSDDGMPEENLLVASLITAGGDPQAALQALTGFRESTLKGFANRKSNGDEGPDMPKGAPKSPDRKGETGNAMKDASAKAIQALKAKNAAAAQQ